MAADVPAFALHAVIVVAMLALGVMLMRASIAHARRHEPPASPADARPEPEPAPPTPRGPPRYPGCHY